MESIPCHPLEQGQEVESGRGRDRQKFLRETMGNAVAGWKHGGCKLTPSGPHVPVEQWSLNHSYFHVDHVCLKLDCSMIGKLIFGKLCCSQQHDFVCLRQPIILLLPWRDILYMYFQAMTWAYHITLSRLIYWWQSSFACMRDPNGN